MRLKNIVLVAVLLFGSFGLSSSARAADITDVATMLEKGNPYDFRLSAGFRTTLTTAALNREYMGNGKGIEIVKDLIYKQTKMELELKAEFAIFKNLAIYVTLPIILKQQNTYSFASGNRYPGYPDEASCRTNHPNDPSVCNPDGVNARNSRTVQDGIAAGLSGIAYDEVNNVMLLPPAFDVGPGEAGARTLFKGPNRSGIDQLHLGIHWLVYGFKQADDDTKPNWRIGTEFRISVGKIMDFKRNAAGDTTCGAASNDNWNCLVDGRRSRPALNDAVSKGVHEIEFYTTVSKRLWLFDTFFHLYFRMPMGYRDGSFYRGDYDFSGSFGEEETSAVNKAPKMAGIRFGTEIVAWERPQDHFKFSIALMGIIDYVFPGRDYSEAYELLAGSPMLNLRCTGATALYEPLCSDPQVRNSMAYFPGVTDVQDYMVFGGMVGFDFLIYKYVKLQFSYSLMHRQEHFVTLTDAGEDTGTAAPQPNGTCTDTVNGCRDGKVNIPSREQNPWHRPAIDTPGHRYRIQEMLVHQIWLNVQFRF